jgi:hypothetical protein
MTESGDNVFDDLLASDGEDGRPAKIAPTMWTRSPFENYVEAEIAEMIYFEHALKTDVEFVTPDDAPPTDARADARFITVHRAMADLYGAHTAIARSLGSAGTWQSYVELCAREGITPLKRSHV